MEWKLLTQIEAQKRLEKYEEMGYKKFLQYTENLVNPSGNLPKEYRNLRIELVKAFKQAQKQAIQTDRKKKQYLTDLYFGGKLFEILKKRGMNVRYASSPRVWTYIAVEVIPDLVFERFGESEYKKSGTFRLHTDRYFKKEARIYPRTLWWYIYLSMQYDFTGNEDLALTVDLLKDNGTDTIVQLVERTGREGYRVAMARKLMKYYSEDAGFGEGEFRKAMVLNSAWTQTVEPALTEGGDERYVKELFSYFCDSNQTSHN